MPNIWFDVTTVLRWPRPPVGVVRVEAECFKYLASLGLPHVKFCHLDKRALAYSEVDAARVLARIRQSEAHPAAPVAPAPGAAARARERAHAVIEALPEAIRGPIQGLAKKTTPVLRTVLHHYRKAGTSVEAFTDQFQELTRPVHTPSTATGPVPFGPGDVLISAGLDWDEKDNVYLYQLKLALGLKIILFCYDLIPVLLPHLCVGEVAGLFARYFVDVAWCADEVMCISKSSQRDFLALVNQTGAPEPRTRIVRLGANLPIHTDDGKIEDLVTGKFLLFVSTIERRKNHEVIYRAIAQLVDQGRTDLPQIVFVGMMGWGVADFLSDLRIDPRVRGRFTLLNHVSDAQLSRLYSKAQFTLYPSLYEGWGLPLAEALAHGKFCLASNTSSLPEVGGALVEYIDPWESRRWAERIAYYLDHPEVLAAREKAIREEYKPPRWADTGRTVFEAATHLLAAAPSTEQPSAA